MITAMSVFYDPGEIRRYLRPREPRLTIDAGLPCARHCRVLVLVNIAHRPFELREVGLIEPVTYVGQGVDVPCNV